ncbi:MAG: glycoside hydrolase N-terminal domain-containing protein [Chitinispirillaceae bacterium]|nr:glycoside hydrolase N-terminal domain-containing protein [Chitinispirillaceae bacterium]
MNEVLRRDFPLLRPEAGLLLGNGTVGAMIWGRDNVLRITLNRSDFWLHRPGAALTPKATYAAIRDHIASKDAAALESLVEQPKNGNGKSGRSTVLPFGRIDLTFSKDTVFKTGYLHLKNGKVVIDVVDNRGPYQISCYIAMDKPLLNVHLLPNRTLPRAGFHTAWEDSGPKLEALGLERPVVYDDQGFSGWIQKRPGDPALCVGMSAVPGDMFIALRYGDSPDKARERTRSVIEKGKKHGSDAIRNASATFWANHWRWVPHVEIPNETLTFLYYYGTYMFASITAPGGTAPTMYGPWTDEGGEPPLDSGYHALANLRMCYAPAFRTNLMHHCKSLFTLVDSWKERLRENAAAAFGIDDGILLPPLVDDRCARLSASWTEVVDPSHGAFIAELMYRQYLYTQDTEFLRATAYPFMSGVMRVYEAMLEKHDGRYEMPLGVSLGYRGRELAAQGRNPSAQLACIHFLCDSLIASARILGEEPRTAWADIAASLPKVAFCKTPCASGETEKEVAVFDDVALDDSYPFHGMFAGVWPFEAIDLDDKEQWNALERAIATWIDQGMGAWESCSLPWASAIHMRLNNADMAEVLLEIWERVFMNESHAAVLDPIFAGFTAPGGSGAARSDRHEILNLDPFMAVTGQILELLLHTRRGVNHLFSGAPQRWKHVSFDNIRTEGAFEVGATRRNNVVTRVSVKANVAGTFRLANPWSAKVTVQRSKATSSAQGRVLEIQLAADERVELTGEA